VQQQQNNQSFFKGLKTFIQHFRGIFSKDASRRMQAIQQSCDDLRQKGDSEERVAIFEDFLQDIEESVKGWPKSSGDIDKKISTGILAFNFLLLTLIYAWGKPIAISQIIALVVLIINIVFNVCYFGMRLTQEHLGIKSTGCLLSFVQLIFTVGTFIVITAMLWYVFPPAVIAFLLASIVVFFVWVLFMVRGTIIAAHIRRVPSLRGNVHNSPSPPTK